MPPRKHIQGGFAESEVISNGTKPHTLPDHVFQDAAQSKISFHLSKSAGIYVESFLLSNAILVAQDGKKKAHFAEIVKITLWPLTSPSPLSDVA